MTPSPPAESMSDADLRAFVAGLLGQAPTKAASLFGLQARWIETPIGPMLAVAGDDGLHLLEFAERRGLPRELERLQARRGAISFGDNDVLAQTAREIDGYFAGTLMAFSVSSAQAGSAFERSVWAALQAVPSGEIHTYKSLAHSLGRPEAIRAVARANGTNQLAIIVPCHRIIGSDGAMVGYGGKIWRKQWLLDHERRHAD
ncbi:methylated-DNA--[protein]-cysteine S-methyltransferase [Sphingoaurantiacus capsulatus]|uniref:Methylated-DNA--[protein]-cysteine S-methyltransferase n=1 Tax=Sphingoaurantiacus capsulatus TaxID=1771310 RepID=A0ABV7XAU2_9SPHN